jgi:hypothetical protein
MTPESGPTSWGAVRQGVKNVSDNDFRKHFSKLAFKNKGPSLLSKVKSLFTSSPKGRHAASRHHSFRNPEEGAFRPGFISGYGAATEAVGAEVLQESKKALSKMALFTIVIVLLYFLKMR